MHIVGKGRGCDLTMIQPSRQSLENVETPGAFLRKAPHTANTGNEGSGPDEVFLPVDATAEQAETAWKQRRIGLESYGGSIS
jgi:hypothetical protein